MKKISSLVMPNSLAPGTWNNKRQYTCTCTCNWCSMYTTTTGVQYHTPNNDNKQYVIVIIKLTLLGYFGLPPTANTTYWALS
jgi:hypothetical protein